jgi:TfoX/Sxy family transcriptional regulator of competence genes
MPYDEKLAERIRPLLAGRQSASEKKMFGELTFMVNNHMCCGVLGKDLVIRTGQEEFEEALARPHARPMDFTGRAMKGFVYVAPPGYKSDSDLEAWIRRGLKFALSESPKPLRNSRRPKSSRRSL